MNAKARAIREGQGGLLDWNQEGIRRHDVKEGRGGRRCHVGKSNISGTTDRYRIEHAINGQSLMPPLPSS